MPTRLQVDPSIGVMDLQRAILKAIQDHEDKDVFNYLKHPTAASFNWKTAPCVQWLAQAKPLLLNYLTIAKNGLLLSAKLCMALRRLMTESKLKINKTPWSSDDFVDQVDSRSRILLAQIGGLAKQDNYMTVMKKGTMLDKQAVDELLGNLEMEAEAPASSRPETCTAVAPYTGPPAAQQSFQEAFEQMFQQPHQGGGACLEPGGTIQQPRSTCEEDATWCFVWWHGFGPRGELK